MSHALHEAIPPLARDVLALYTEALAAVRFPDLDLSLLEGLVEELAAAQHEVERCEAELEQARAQRAARAEALEASAERALSYARVFAEGKPELAARVAEIRSARASSSSEPVAPKKRGRPKKSDAEAGLFDGSERSHPDASENEHPTLM